MTPFQSICQSAGLPVPVPELRFAPPRRWRFDWAWVADDGIGGLALEIDGGIWTRGRHTRGAGVLKDQEKLNEAAILGWKVLRVTPKQFESGVVLDLLRRAFGR